MNYSGRGNSSGEKCTRNKGEREEEKGGKKTEGVEEEEIAYSQGKAEGVIVQKSRRCAGNSQSRAGPPAGGSPTSRVAGAAGAPAGGARFFTGPPFWAKFMVQ